MGIHKLPTPPLKKASVTRLPVTTARPKRTPPPKRTPGLAAALFSNTQQRVLGLLFGQPDRSYYATELINLAGGGSGAVQRELGRLETSGLVVTHRVGNQKHFQANAASPIFAELVAIMAKTVGIAEPLRAALDRYAKKIRVAFVYGSIAKGGDTARSDIDVMIIGDGLSYTDLFSALEACEATLGRHVNPTIYTLDEFDKKRGTNGFLKRVLAQNKIFLIGSEAELG